MNIQRALMVFIAGWTFGFTTPKIVKDSARLFERTNSNTFYIGALLCLTGECAEWGTESLNGMRLAVSELNQQGGILERKIELQIEDSQDTTPANTVTAYKKMRMNKDINYIVGPTWSPAGLAVAPLAKADPNIILTSPSLGIKDFDHAGSNLFNIWPHDESKARLLAKFAASKSWKRVAVFSSQQPWSRDQGDFFADEFTKLGFEISAKVEPLDSSRDLKAEALKIVDSKPDAIFFSNFSEQAAIALRELRRLGYNGPRMIVLLDETTRGLANGNLEGIYWTDNQAPEPKFKNRYESAFKQTPKISAEYGYDSVMLYAEAIRKVGSFKPEKVQPILSSIKNYKGASGDITFDKSGGVLKSPKLFQLSGDDVTKVDF